MTKDNVVLMFGEILHDIPCEDYLKKVAENNDLYRCIVIGETEGGSLFFGANIGDMEVLSWLMLRANTQMGRIAQTFKTEDDGILP